MLLPPPGPAPCPLPYRGRQDLGWLGSSSAQAGMGPAGMSLFGLLQDQWASFNLIYISVTQSITQKSASGISIQGEE